MNYFIAVILFVIATAFIVEGSERRNSIYSEDGNCKRIVVRALFNFPPIDPDC